MSTRPDDATVPYAPAHPALIAAAVCVLFVLVLFLPMFTGKFLGGEYSDQLWTGIPFRNFWTEEVRRTGSIPLWNPFMFGGLPFVGAMHGDIFYPTSFLRLLVRADTALNLTFFIHITLAGMFTYAFLRTLGTTWTASVVGALAYQLSGIVSSQVGPGHDGKMIVSALLPLLLTGLVLAIRRRRPEAFALVALVVGLDILSPHVQTSQYSLIFAGIFTLYLCFFDEQRPELPRQRWTALGLAALAVVIGMGISMIQMYPFIQNSPFAARVAGVQGWQYATSYAMPVANIVDWAVPTFTGSSIWGYYWAGSIKLHSEYLGAAVLVLAAIGIVNPRRRMSLWLGACFLLFLLVCLGAQTPFYRLWYALVPGVKVTRAPGMAFFIPTFIVACFAAFGVERIERREPTRAPWIAMGVAGLILLLGLSGGLSMLAEGMASDEMRPAVQEIADMIRLGAVISALAVLAIAGLVVAATQGRVRGLPLALGLVLIVGADLFISAKRSFVWSPPATELFAPDEVIAHMQRTPYPYRTLDLPVMVAENRPPTTAYPTAFLMYDRVPQSLGHHGNELHAYDQLLGGKNVWANLRNLRLWPMLGIRYLTLPGELNVPGFHEVARSTTPAGATVRGGGRQVVLYEADTVPPYARVVPAALKVPEDRIVATLQDPRLDFNRLVLFPDSIALAVPQLDSIPPAMAARATVSEWQPGRMTIRLDPVPEREGYLVIAENWYPDWQATVDGQATPTLRGQMALLTVPVARGAREVTLEFKSASYRTGRMLTAGSVVMMLLLAAVPMIRRRRSA